MKFDLIEYIMKDGSILAFISIRGIVSKNVVGIKSLSIEVLGDEYLYPYPEEKEDLR